MPLEYEPLAPRSAATGTQSFEADANGNVIAEFFVCNAGQSMAVFVMQTDLSNVGVPGGCDGPYVSNSYDRAYALTEGPVQRSTDAVPTAHDRPHIIQSFYKTFADTEWDVRVQVQGLKSGSIVLFQFFDGAIIQASGSGGAELSNEGSLDLELDPSVTDNRYQLIAVGLLNEETGSDTALVPSSSAVLDHDLNAKAVNIQYTAMLKNFPCVVTWTGSDIGAGESTSVSYVYMVAGPEAAAPTDTLVPGTGWGQDVQAADITAAEAAVGTSTNIDYATKVSGYINVVPFQDVTGPFQIGVFCAGRQGYQSIEKVEFVADDGTALDATLIERNPRTGDFEYFVTIDPDDFTGSGWTQIRARGIPYHGTPRLFSYDNRIVARNTHWHQLDLYVNKGTVHEATWVIGTHGTDLDSAANGGTNPIATLYAANSNEHGGTTILLPDGNYDLDLSSLTTQTYEANGRNARWLTFRAINPGGVTIDSVTGSWDGHLRLDGCSLDIGPSGNVGAKAIWWSGDETNRWLTGGSWDSANAFDWIHDFSSAWTNGIPTVAQAPEHGLYCTGVWWNKAGSQNQGDGVMFDRRTGRYCTSPSADCFNRFQYVFDVQIHPSAPMGNPPNHSDIIAPWFAAGPTGGGPDWNYTNYTIDNLCLLHSRLVTAGATSKFEFVQNTDGGSKMTSLWMCNNVISDKWWPTSPPTSMFAAAVYNTQANCQVLYHHNTILHGKDGVCIYIGDMSGSAFIGNIFSVAIGSIIDGKMLTDELIGYGNVNQGDYYGIWSGNAPTSAFQTSFRDVFPNIKLSPSNMDPLQNGSYVAPPPGGIVTVPIDMQNADFHPSENAPAARRSPRMWPVDRLGNLRNEHTSAGALRAADEIGMAQATAPAVRTKPKRYTEVLSVSDRKTERRAKIASSNLLSIENQCTGVGGNVVKDLADGTTYANDHANIKDNFTTLADRLNLLMEEARKHGIID